MLLGACNSSSPISPRERSDFNADWRFHLGDGLQAAQPGFADNDWRVLNLPHDWAIEGDFSRENPSGTGGGALPGGVGWYRKTFSVDNADIGKIFRIEFDGVYMNSEVFINGVSLPTSQPRRGVPQPARRPAQGRRRRAGRRLVHQRQTGPAV